MSRLSDMFFALRDRLVSDLAFQRKISAVPGFRFIANTQARQVFDLCSGFVYSQILLACVELDIFEILRDRPQTAEAIAARAGLDLTAAERLLNAAVSLKLVSRRAGGRYGLGMRGAAIAGNGGLIEMIKHHRMFYADMRDPVALLKGSHTNTELARYWAYARGEGRNLENRDIAPYSALMSKSQTLVADMLLDIYPLEKHRVLIDIGGGDGEFILRAAARHPHLSFKHFDLPAVSKLAMSRFDAAGLNDRAVSTGGSFFDTALPAGADVATLIRIIHDHNEKNARAILAAARRALASSGVLLIAEPLAGTAGAEPMSDAYFAFYLMAMGSGRPRTFDELKALVLGAGFASVKEVRSNLPLQFRLLVAQT